jgi:hypothetical protein
MVDFANYDALVGVALGAGLTYGFSALNRRHQEAREDRTRWYGERLHAYAELSRAYVSAAGATLLKDYRRFTEAYQVLAAAVGPVLLVGSPEAKDAAIELGNTVRDWKNHSFEDMRVAWRIFETAARKDLGHPQPRA